MNQIDYLLKELFTWQAILDIIIITSALFFLYRTLERLGTWKILAGTMAAFLIFALASLLDLEGVKWIFRNVSHVAVLGIIVLFQPELRKVFEKIVSLHGANSTGPSDETDAVLAASLLQLAQQKIGALIVLPGSEPVKERLSGGHRLAAVPSVPLIMSIFDPSSPGHDGAMIVEDDLLSLFGVRLPISQTSRLAEDYGTRHHAAMGLAEQTDALVLVVSEERGVISAFREGTVQELQTAAQIIAEIREHTSRLGFVSGERRSPIDRRTLVPLAASLLVACIFWSTLVSVNRAVIERVVPVMVEYIPPAEGLILSGEKAEKVSIHLAGPKAEIDNFLLSEPTVKVDLSTMVQGKQTILITAENLKLPERISFLASEPSHIEVTLAGVVFREVPVMPQLVGTLPANLKLKSIKVDPAQVWVLTQATNRGEKPPSVSTTPIYLNSVLGDSRILCKIVAAPGIQPAEKPWPDVEVIIEVEKVP